MSATAPRGLRPDTLLHRLPWNGLFWLASLGLVGGAVAFGIGGHLQHTHRVVEKTAEIADGDSVKVVLILNGDEVMVEKEGGRARVRMLGIRAFDPVVNEREITAFGHASVSFLANWALEKTVTVVFDNPVQDVRGRYLAYLQRGDVDLNERMVEEGIAMVYTEYTFGREQGYLTAERLARSAGRGIWGGRKSVARAVALRHQWAAALQERTGAAPPDYLLDEGHP